MDQVEQMRAVIACVVRQRNEAADRAAEMEGALMLANMRIAELSKKLEEGREVKVVEAQ